MQILYTLKNLSRNFGEREVLHIEHLEIEAGGIYALLGDNGAGKSTLMQILAFLDSPSSGELFFRGQKVSKGDEARFRAGVVWVPQFPVMFTGSLLYNVEYPMALQKQAKSVRRKKAMELLDIVNLSHLAKAPAHKLSGGESQRASIARALAAGAEIIHFDEPTANVDQHSVGDFSAIVQNIRQEKSITMLITTHNAELAASLCSKHIFLAEGRLVEQRLLPDGVTWPAILSDKSLQVGPDFIRTMHLGANCTGQVMAISSIASGVKLRLELSPGHFANFLLEDEASRINAKALTLGTSLAIQTA